jgi:hypothetical protein
MKRRAYIHGFMSAVATKIRGRLEYLRYVTYRTFVVRAHRGHGHFGAVQRRKETCPALEVGKTCQPP